MTRLRSISSILFSEIGRRPVGSNGSNPSLRDMESDASADLHPMIRLHTSSTPDQLLTPEYFYDVVKRRWLYFVIPFVLVFGVGAVITALLPATYVSEGKMLIESQEIPSDLVQPTVSTVADERVALLQQRIMVRDKLLAIAAKYQLAELAKKERFFGRWRPQLSSTDIVDMMRERTQIAPIKNDMPVRPGQRQFIAFTVSFENEVPQVARQVANELVTTILDEDVRARTNSALETTRFLERESQRLERRIECA